MPKKPYRYGLKLIPGAYKAAKYNPFLLQMPMLKAWS